MKEYIEKKMDCFPYRISFKYVLRRLMVVNLHEYPSAFKNTLKFFTVRKFSKSCLAAIKSFPKTLM